MFLLNDRLSTEQLEGLRELSKSVVFTDAKSYRRRMGASGRLSVYRYSKWLTWGIDKRTAFKAAFPQEIIKGALVGWFLDFPVITGFLDRVETWVNTSVAGYIVTYNISQTHSSIWIDGQEVSVAPGQAMAFSLRHVHEIKASKSRATWASVMLQGPLLEWTEECKLFKTKVEE